MDVHQNDVTESPSQVVVVVVPLPAQGHLNQLLHLSRILTARGMMVHCIGTATHNRQAKDRVQGSNISDIHFHDFQIPEFITPPPDPHASTKFPIHLMPTFEASVQLREPLGVLLRSLSSTNRRVVVVHDSLMSFAAEEASFVSNAEAYCFHSISAFALSYYKWEVLGKPAYEAPGGNLVPRDVARVSFDDSFPESLRGFVARNVQWRKFDVGYIFNSCDVIEGKYVDLIAQQQVNKEHWAFGPFNPVTFDSAGEASHRCLEWLHKQEPSSVIYVSFGTQTSVSDDQIAQIAIGLERSEQKFIWVLRDADRGDIYNEDIRNTQLPNGFEERTKGVGMVLRDWAPQLQILAHSSTGGFLSHCGWNSCMESLSMGKPIAAWPMHSDQPKNAVLMSEVLKVGLVVREWAHRGEITSSVTVESSIRKLMASEEGIMMKKRANELGIAVRLAVSEGGTSNAQLESFVTHISR